MHTRAGTRTHARTCSCLHIGTRHNVSPRRPARRSCQARTRTNSAPARPHGLTCPHAHTLAYTRTHMYCDSDRWSMSVQELRNLQRERQQRLESGQLCLVHCVFIVSLFVLLFYCLSCSISQPPTNNTINAHTHVHGCMYACARTCIPARPPACTPTRPHKRPHAHAHVHAHAHGDANIMGSLRSDRWQRGQENLGRGAVGPCVLA